MNLIQIYKQFPTQEACIEHLEQMRWHGKPVCPYCKSTNNYKATDRLRHHCNSCRKSFSVTIGTIFEDTRLPMQKWFMAIALVLNAKKGISSCQLGRDIEVRQATAWSMLHRIRKAMKQDGELLRGIIEMDETYIGGKPRKEGKKKDDDDDNFPNSKMGRGTDKLPVVGMIERDGKVKARNVKKDELRSPNLMDLVRKSVDCDNAMLMTDQFKGYINMHKIISHQSLNHTLCYANGTIHTNTIESFWAIVKRGIVGQFHKVSAKYLEAYIDEFCWRFNQRKNVESFDKLVGNLLQI